MPSVRQQQVHPNNSLEKENLLSRLDRLLEWIRNSDTKASIVLATIGIFLTIFSADYIINVFKTLLVGLTRNINIFSVLYFLILTISIGLLIYGIYCLIRVLIPRLEKNNETDEERSLDSLYYFETIAKNSYIQFRDKMYNESKEDEFEDILSQIYVNAKICTFKYDYSSKGMKYSFIGISGIIVSYIAGYILLKLGGFH